MITVLYPKVDKIAEICDIRHDANGIVCKNTDTLVNARLDYVEYLCFLYNQISTGFINPYNPNSPDNLLQGAFETGAYVPDIYFPTDRWWNPVTQVIELIPDYDDTTWSQAGVDAFGATLGETKPDRYPDHGQNMFDISGGNYGYDYINGVSGLSNMSELKNLVSEIYSWFVSLTGFNPSTISYRNGENPTWQVYVPYYLAGRNSSYTGLPTAYGQGKSGNWLGTPNTPTNRQQRLNMNSTIRWADYPTGDAAANTIVQNSINAVKTNKGFFNNFVHDHSTTHARLKSLFSLVDSTIGGTFMWRTSYGEAMQYFWFREMAQNANISFLEDGVLVWVDYKDTFKGTFSNGIPNDILLSAIRTPLSVKVNLSGSYLEGKNIKSNYGYVISLGDNEYIVECPFGKGIEGLKGIKLTEDNTPDYYNFNKAEIITSEIVDGVLTVTTDKNTKAVLFSRVNGSSDVTNKVLSRDNIPSKTHIFSVSTGSTYMVGLITKEKVLSISAEIIN